MQNITSHSNNQAIVFHSQKELSSGKMLEVTVTALPCENGMLTYNFYVTLESKDSSECSKLENVTSDSKNAKMLFDILTEQNVFPCHLRDVTENFLISI